MEDGYYWARHPKDGSRFIVYHDTSDGVGAWWICGIGHPIDDMFDPSSIICRVQPPHN